MIPIDRYYTSVLQLDFTSMINYSTYNHQLNGKLNFTPFNFVGSFYGTVLSLFVNLFKTLQNQFSIFTFQGTEQALKQTNSENGQDEGSQPTFFVQLIDSSFDGVLFPRNFKIYI